MSPALLQANRAHKRPDKPPHVKSPKPGLLVSSPLHFAHVPASRFAWQKLARKHVHLALLVGLASGTDHARLSEPSGRHFGLSATQGAGADRAIRRPRNATPPRGRVGPADNSSGGTDEPEDRNRPIRPDPRSNTDCRETTGRVPFPRFHACQRRHRATFKPTSWVACCAMISLRLESPIRSEDLCEPTRRFHLSHCGRGDIRAT